jgi:hypothetical protein
MHAVVATVSIKDPEVAREALAGLGLNVIPKAPVSSAHTGWSRSIGADVSIIVFETKEHADKAVAYPLPPLSGVMPPKAGIREVNASA